VESGSPVAQLIFALYVACTGWVSDSDGNAWIWEFFVPKIHALMMALLLVAAAAVGVVRAGPASAAAQTLCTGFSGCSAAGYGNAGYSSVYTNSYWGQYGGHNCTNYVAYRFQNAGIGKPGWLGIGNADMWGVWAAGITNGAPSVGSIAWWSASSAYGVYGGHVSIVEQVNADGSFIDSDDNYGGDFDWRKYTPGSRDWPTGFIHYNDAALAGGGGGGPVSVTASNNNGQLAVQLHNFPAGTSYYYCHTGDPSGYPTGGSVPNHGSVDVTDPNQSWPSGLCSGSGNFWIGIQATDGHDYYSNQVALGSSPPLVTSANDNGQMVVALHNFPGGTSYFFCHTGDPAGYPTGGSVPNHGSFVVTDPNQSWPSGVCAGSGNFWLGIQATDGNDYYSNQVILGQVNAPSAPIHVVATANIRSANLSWDAPASDGLSPVTGYTATASPGGATCHTSTNTWCQVKGLTNGHSYRLSVTAANAIGTSAPSSMSTTVVPGNLPGAPWSVTASPRSRSALVSWKAPSSDGGRTVTAYLVDALPGYKTCTAGSRSRSCTVTGLKNGVSYHFRVYAYTAIGASNYGHPATVVAGSPTAPRATRMRFPSKRHVVASWRAPAHLGSGLVVRYLVRWSGNGHTWSRWSSVGKHRTVSRAGLSKSHRYWVQVRAVNGSGSGLVATDKFTQRR
jgi:surface antigen